LGKRKRERTREEKRERGREHAIAKDSEVQRLPEGKGRCYFGSDSSSPALSLFLSFFLSVSLSLSLSLSFFHFFFVLSPFSLHSFSSFLPLLIRGRRGRRKERHRAKGGKEERATTGEMMKERGRSS